MNVPNKRRDLCRKLALAAALAAAPVVWAQQQPAIEPAITPTVYPTLVPKSALPMPLEIQAPQLTVWKSQGVQRVLAAGGVTIQLGYRKMTATNAVISLRPSREAGEALLDVAIYLSGDVGVKEGSTKGAATSQGSELLVTTQISGTVRLAGATPQNQAEEDNPLVRRAAQLWDQVQNAPPEPIYIPKIVITPTEEALQKGWIARGPGNRIIAGPLESQIAAAQGMGVAPSAVGAASQGAATQKAQPLALVTYDNPGDITYRTINGQQVAVVENGFHLLYDDHSGKPPVQMNGQRAVLFLTSAGAAGEKKTPGGVVGVYIEGDVMIEQGASTIRAERLFYDLPTKRAIMIDAVLSSVDTKRNVPLYLRANELRQITRGEFTAKDVRVSTSEFYTPHYSIGATNAYVQDITPANVPDVAGGTRTYAIAAKNATFRVGNVPLFYWPYFSADTSENNIPLRTIRAGYSNNMGLTLQTDWDIFGLLGVREPPGVKANLRLDYFGDRGPGGGIDSTYNVDSGHGQLRSYILRDWGKDQLGRDRDNLSSNEEIRGRITWRHQLEISPDWTAQVEGSYISDPNFLEEYYPNEYEREKPPETSLYLKYAHESQALTFLGKWSLMDFTASADQVDDQLYTEKTPEIKYWRLGDSLGDWFTYYSESSFANLQQKATDFTPAFSGLQALYVMAPNAAAAEGIRPGETYREYYARRGWLTQHVMRGDTRQEIDIPLQIGPLKLVPYAAGRLTFWDDQFPESNTGDGTTRVWGQVGVRGAMQFWRTYDEINSRFWDVHRIRHIIEPSFVVFQTGSNYGPGELQPFDRAVEGISDASGAILTLQQRWQTKRGAPQHQRTVDWLVWNLSGAAFWNQDDAGFYTETLPGLAAGHAFGGPENSAFPEFDMLNPLRGFGMFSRPELSQVRNSIYSDVTWRAGERVRYMAEGNYNVDDQRLEQFAQGVAIDHSPDLSYFIGNRYVREAANTDEWTVGFQYALTRKYTMAVTQSYDLGLKRNVLSTMTLMRRFPRINAALTLTYDANEADTAAIVTIWPEGYPSLGVGSNQVMQGMR